MFLPQKTQANKNKNGKTHTQNKKTKKKMWQNEKARAFAPQQMFRKICDVFPQFRGYAQQDAHEFLRGLLDYFDEQLRYGIPFDNQPSRTNQITYQTFCNFFFVCFLLLFLLFLKFRNFYVCVCVCVCVCFK